MIIGSSYNLTNKIHDYPVFLNNEPLIYNALIQPYFYYCSPLWDICGTQLLDKLQKFQNRAVRIIAGTRYEIESAVVLETLGWENLKSRRQKLKSILLYKIINEYTAPNLKESLTGSNLTQANYPPADGAKRRAMVLIPPAIYTRGNESISQV